MPRHAAVRTTHPVYRVLGTQAVREAQLGSKLVPRCPCDPARPLVILLYAESREAESNAVAVALK